MLSVTRFSALGAVREKLLYGRNCCNSTVRLWSDYLWKFVNMVVKFSCKSPNNLQLSFTSGLCSHLLVIRGARTTFFIGRAGSSPPFLSHFPSLISPFPPRPLEVGHLSLPSHSLLSVPSTPMPYLSSPFPLEVPGPWNLTRKSGGSAVSSPSRVWGRAPAEITFGAFWLHPVAAVSVIFVRINLPKFNFGKLNENHKYWQSKTYSLPYQSHSWQGNCPPAHYVPGPLFAVCRIGNATAECIVCKKKRVAIATEVTRFCFVLLKLQFCLVTFSLHVLLSITWWPLPRLNKFRELPTNCLRRNVHCTKHTSSHTNCTCSPELLWQLTGRTHGIPNSVHLNLIVDTKIGQNKHV